MTDYPRSEFTDPTGRVYFDLSSTSEYRSRARFDGAIVFLLGCFCGAVSALAVAYLFPFVVKAWEAL